MKEDWIECALGEVFKTTSGGTPSRRNISYYEGSIPWVKSGELDKGLINDTEEKISEEALKNSSAKIFPKGTLLIALYGATIGKLSFLGIDASTNQAICGIFQNENFSSKYLYNFLLFKRTKLISQGTGGAQPNISQTILKKLQLPVPPLIEQHAIVNKIEALFSSLDSGIADLKRAQDQLKIYRQAVLKKAFEGELTNEWREKNNIYKEWEFLTFNDVLEIISGKNQKEVEDTNGAYPIYGSGGKFGRANDYLCEVGTTIIGRKGTINSPIYVKEKFWNVDTAFGLSPLEKIDSLFLFYFCLGFNFKRLDKSTTIPSLAKRDLLKISINVPTKEEQHQIVQEIESRLSVCDAVEQSITESLDKAQALRQSILKKAFEGKLLTQEEIAKCKAHPDYEPASVLLERIKKEKVNK
jgi:type I restriction enzyme S subunit